MSVTRIQDYKCFDDQVFEQLETKLTKVANKTALSDLYAGFIGSEGFSDKYNFDDGAIWYIEKDVEGNEYLVKQVDDNDELIRVAVKEIFK